MLKSTKVKMIYDYLSKPSSYQREIDWSSEVDVFCLAKNQGQGSEGHEQGTKALQ